MIPGIFFSMTNEKICFHLLQHKSLVYFDKSNSLDIQLCYVNIHHRLVKHGRVYFVYLLSIRSMFLPTQAPYLNVKPTGHWHWNRNKTCYLWKTETPSSPFNVCLYYVIWSECVFTNCRRWTSMITKRAFINIWQRKFHINVDIDRNSFLLTETL